MSDYAEEVERMTFEECMKALEDIVNELEKGEKDLESSIGSFEKAVLLRNRCKAILDDSERRIQKIVETSNGTVVTDFNE